MDSRTISEIMMKQMDGPLADPEKQQLMNHIEGCPDCRQEYDEWQDLVQALNSLPEPMPSPGFETRVMAAIDPHLYAAPQRMQQRIQTGRMLVWMGLLGLVSLLVLETATLLQNLALDWLQATEMYRALAVVYERIILGGVLYFLMPRKELVDGLLRFEPAGQWWLVLGTLNLMMFLVLIKVSLDRLRSAGRGEAQ